MSTTISEARREANRRNARKSTGPRTEAGKAASRRNALRHGLTAEVVELEAGGAGVPAVGAVAWPGWLAGQVARAMMQIDRAQAIEARLREEAVFRALDSWDDDQVVRAEELGAQLARHPGRVVARLRRTPHGCDWLIERWGWLARAAAADGGWTEAQGRLAFELLGVAEEGRVGTPAELAAARGWVGAAEAPPGELARAMLDELHAQREATRDADTIAQAGAEAGLDDLPTADLARVRRYELALQRRLRWLLDELADGPSSAAPAPTPTPITPAAEAVEPPAAPAPADAGDEDEGEAEAAAIAPRGGTNPSPARPGAHPAPETRRSRPDLDRAARRDRKKRRHRRCG